MAVVWVPSLMREITGGREKVEVSGASLRQVINNLETEFPGFKERVMEGDRLSPSVSVAIDGAIISMGLMERMGENSEVSFLPNVSGGMK